MWWSSCALATATHSVCQLSSSGAHYLEVPWVVISGVKSPLVWVMTIVTLLITPLLTTHEPPSANTAAATTTDVDDGTKKNDSKMLILLLRPSPSATMTEAATVFLYLKQRALMSSSIA